MRIGCLTIDIESDHGLLRQECFDIIEKHGDEVISFFASLDVPLTLFVTGEVIEKHSDFLKKFAEKTGSEIELHSYSHHTKNLTESEEVLKSLRIYKKAFGCNPKGYRVPYGKVGKHTADILSENGFLYHSSVFTSKYVYYYGNEIYKYKTGLLEIPVSKILRIPYGQGFINFFGKLFPHVFFYGKDFLMEYMHLHDFFYSEQVRNLPFYFKIFYEGKQKNPDDTKQELKNRVKKLKDMGYVFKTMSSYLAEQKTNG